MAGVAKEKKAEAVIRRGWEVRVGKTETDVTSRVNRSVI